MLFALAQDTGARNLASIFRISVLISAAAIFYATGVTVSFADTLASVLYDTDKDLLTASSPNLAVSLEEGSEITAYVKLKRKPKSEVRISFTSSGPLELNVYNPLSAPYGGSVVNYSPPPVLIFDSSNWNEPQTISIKSIEDGSADGTRTLPLRMSISSRGMATVTKPIWVHSVDSETVTDLPPELLLFKSTGTIDHILEGGPDKNLTRLSAATALASHDGTQGTAKFLVNSRKFNIKNRVIEFDYTINADHKVIVGQVRGISPRVLSLDLNYVYAYIFPYTDYGNSGKVAFGLSGVMAIRQPERGMTDAFFVTSIGTVKDFADIAQYAGEWYEQSSAKTKGSARLFNTTYTYTPRPDGKIDVEYAGNYGSINGTIQKASGIATVVSDIYSYSTNIEYSYSTNTQFNVSYSRWNSVRPPSRDYRIVDFAPDYSWAIASDSFGGNGVILSREQVIEDTEYNALLGLATRLGVDTTKFTRTNQIAPP